MTTPFRCPIIYPGAPTPPLTWTAHIRYVCAFRGHVIRKGTTVCRTPAGFMCVSCAQRCEMAGEAESAAT